MLKTFSQKRSSTNPFGINPSKPSTPTAPDQLPFKIDEGLSGWRTNNWALQMDTLPWLRDNIMFAREMEPGRQDALRSTIQRLQNPQSQADAFRAGRMGGARDEGFRLGQMLSQSDPSSAMALQQGATLDANNRAASESSAFDAYLQSPQGQQEALQAILQAFSQAYNPAAQQAYQGITNTALGVEQFNLQNDMSRKKSGGGLGGILGSVLGMATGGGWGNILGAITGGGGGGSAPMPWDMNTTSNQYGQLSDEWGNYRG